MRFLKFLNEKYDGTVPGRVGNVFAEVFVNPSRKEYRDALEASKVRIADGAVRAFFDPKRNTIWIWRADVLHDTVLREMPIPTDSLKFILEPVSKRLFLYGDLNLSRLAGEKGIKAIEEIEQKARKAIKKFAPESSSWRLVTM